MKVTVPHGPDLRAECIFILGRLFAHLPEEPHTINQIARDLAKRHNIPCSVLSELFAPLEAMETALTEALSGQAALLEPFFRSGSQNDNGLPWAYFILEHEGTDFREPTPALRRRLLSLTLNCTLTQTEQVEDMAGLLRFLSTFPCDSRTKWVCTQVWEDPAHYHRLYSDLMEQATGVLQQHMDALMPLFRETRAHILQELDADSERYITQFGLPDTKIEQVLLVPTFGGFNGTGIYWDHTTPGQTVILIEGVFHARIRALRAQYSCSSKALADRLKILSDPSRIEILKALSQGPMFSQELRERLSLSPGTITHHMSLLVGEGYITVRKEGVRVQYSLCQEGLQVFLSGLQSALLRDN
ncbi:MAG: winged helix-turn-helix transcriptional regulator [Oscillospiraceae bacterium]|nr:winged helix-turn-helix transcriptional regulator [Oscillospiraceae bacterium]